MFCHQCGQPIEADHRFCKNCGTELNPLTDEQELHKDVHETLVSEMSDQQVKHQQIEEIAKTTTENKKNKKELPFTKILVWLIPVVTCIAVGASLLGYYMYEKSMNDRVLALKSDAETAALEGHLTKAEVYLEEALELRPHYETLKDMILEVQKAHVFSEDLNTVFTFIESQQYKEAEEHLNHLEELMSEETGPLFHSILGKMDEAQTIITVGIIKEELDELDSVAALHDKLQMIEGLSTAEGEEVKKQILTKIVKLTMDHATVKLDEKHFTEALNIVNHGLEYVPNDDKLLAMKERIQQEQLAFEQAEQQRIEQAMEAAARQDLINRTEAVEVLNIETVLDDYGDLYIYGSVKNVATRPISSITIEYSLYHGDGLYFDSGVTYVFPYFLAPGEEGMFEEVIYFVNEDVSVQIDNITWYLD